MAIQVINQIQPRSIDKSSPFSLTEYLGLSTDIKPVDCARGSTFHEEDTDYIYEFNGSSWFLSEIGNNKNIAIYDNSGKESFNSLFGDRIIGKRKAKFSANFNYPTDTRATIKTETNGGTVTLDVNLLTLQTGTNVAGLSRIQTVENLRYFAGREAELMATAKFTLGVSNSFQRSGLFDSQDGIWFGYSGVQFGLGIRKGGNDTFIPQTSFNVDKADGNGKSGFILNTTKINIYRISYGYLGIAPITLQVYGGYIKGWVTLHMYDISNISEITHINKPYLPLRAEVINNGNNTNLKLQSGSVYCGTIDGDQEAVDASSREFSYKLSATQTAANNNLLVIFHNKPIYGGTPNKIEDLLLKVGIAVEGVKPVRVDLYSLSTPPTGTSFTDIDTTNSNMEVSTTGTFSLTGANLLDSWALAKTDGINVDVSKLNQLLTPDKYAVFVASSTGNYDIELVNRWSELF